MPFSVALFNCCLLIRVKQQICYLIAGLTSQGEHQRPSAHLVGSGDLAGYLT
jgi:hypothetical protein